MLVHQTNAIPGEYRVLVEGGQSNLQQGTTEVGHIVVSAEGTNEFQLDFETTKVTGFVSKGDSLLCGGEVVFRGVDDETEAVAEVDCPSGVFEVVIPSGEYEADYALSNCLKHRQRVVVAPNSGGEDQHLSLKLEMSRVHGRVATNGSVSCAMNSWIGVVAWVDDSKECLAALACDGTYSDEVPIGEYRVLARLGREESDRYDAALLASSQQVGPGADVEGNFAFSLVSLHGEVLIGNAPDGLTDGCERLGQVELTDPSTGLTYRAPVTCQGSAFDLAVPPAAYRAAFLPVDTERILGSIRLGDVDVRQGGQSISLSAALAQVHADLKVNGAEAVFAPTCGTGAFTGGTLRLKREDGRLVEVPFGCSSSLSFWTDSGVLEVFGKGEASSLSRNFAHGGSLSLEGGAITDAVFDFPKRRLVGVLRVNGALASQYSRISFTNLESKENVQQPLGYTGAGGFDLGLAPGLYRVEAFGPGPSLAKGTTEVVSRLRIQ